MDRCTPSAHAPSRLPARPNFRQLPRIDNQTDGFPRKVQQLLGWFDLGAPVKRWRRGSQAWPSRCSSASCRCANACQNDVRFVEAILAQPIIVLQRVGHRIDATAIGVIDTMQTPLVVQRFHTGGTGNEFHRRPGKIAACYFQPLTPSRNLFFQRRRYDRVKHNSRTSRNRIERFLQTSPFTNKRFHLSGERPVRELSQIRQNHVPGQISGRIR